jgi:hypothetical protein
MIESPTLYLATDKGFTLADEDISKLRDYIAAGGMVVCAPEGNKPQAPLASMKALAKKLYPDRELAKVETNHPFYNLAQPVKGILPDRDGEQCDPPAGRDRREGSRPRFAGEYDKQRDTFELLANIYLYATGRDSRRPRLATNYTPPSRLQSRGEVDADCGAPLNMTEILIPSR